MKVFYFILCIMYAVGLNAAEEGLFNTSTPAFSKPLFLPVDEAFGLSAQLNDDSSLTLRWQMQPGYYLYRQKLSFVYGSGSSVQLPGMPQGLKKSDEFFGDVEVYYDELTLELPLPTTSLPRKDKTINIGVGYQGCADAGLCYPPQTRLFEFKDTDQGVLLPVASSHHGHKPS